MNKTMTFVLLICLAATSALGGGGIPNLADVAGIDTHDGSSLDPALSFIDEQGRPVTLGMYMGQPRRPLVLTLGYAQCAMHCKRNRRGVIKALQRLPIEAGRDYIWLMISIDPEERVQEALLQKNTAVAGSGLASAQDGWHVLTGERTQIMELADEVGFRYTYDKRSGRYAHPVGSIVITPDGRISGYLPGPDYDSLGLATALAQAAGGKVGDGGDLESTNLVRCVPISLELGPYSRSAMVALRIIAMATVLALGVLIAWLMSRSASRGMKKGATRQ